VQHCGNASSHNRYFQLRILPADFPALFGYTLANIPLAEAANHFGLIGPVYAIIDENNPFQSAIEECRRTFNQLKNIDLMLACHFDHLRPNTNTQQLRITFAIID